jgi:hypothetical protein
VIAELRAAYEAQLRDVTSALAAREQEVADLAARLEEATAAADVTGVSGAVHGSADGVTLPPPKLKAAAAAVAVVAPGVVEPNAAAQVRWRAGQRFEHFCCRLDARAGCGKCL